MTRKARAIALPMVIASVLSVAAPPSVSSETLVERNVDARVIVALRVDEAKLRGRIAPPWQLNAPAKGASKGANLFVVFIDRLLLEDGAGKPKGGGLDRMVVFVSPAKNPQTGESALLIVRVFTADPNGPPGFYNNSLHASIHREHATQGTLDAVEGSETWRLRTIGGEELQLRLGYTRGALSRSRTDARVRAATEPNRWRIYRVGDQGVDVVRSVPLAVNRVKHYELRIGLAEFQDVFDGSERLVSIAVLPWYVRQTFLP